MFKPRGVRVFEQIKNTLRTKLECLMTWGRLYKTLKSLFNHCFVIE